MIARRFHLRQRFPTYLALGQIASAPAGPSSWTSGVLGRKPGSRWPGRLTENDRTEEQGQTENAR
jgi:hypothetical protein